MAVRLTYCSNVHPAPDYDSHVAALHEHAAPVASRARAAGRDFGLGAWWPVDLARTLAHDATLRADYAATLGELGLPLWTVNVFPFDGFHDEVVKTGVYSPDWGHEDRLQYTRDCAAVAAALAPRGATVALSSLPLGYRGPGDPEPDRRLMARNLARCASAFAALEDETGVRCVLALEPEPDCLLETAAGTAAFLEDWLFDEGAWSTIDEAALRRHLGVCVDLCHLAVVGEDPVAALEDLRARRIAVPKIQVSSCLELRDPSGLDRLLAFDEARYLHQTASASGLRALDLGDVRARREEFATGGRIRTHYHVPLYWDEDGAFGSTRAEVERVLRWLGGGDRDRQLPLLEVETYTWSVLDGFDEGEPLANRLERELTFAAGCLAGG
ncbi:MAG: metabolite traffic protein EboE [bacterium]|nr:metabolite traffic protein EboE [bacterium]